MLNGLDLFSGIGGLSIALSEWVRPIAYCEIDPYCQGVLLSRMASGLLREAPLWDDIRNLAIRQSNYAKLIDILYGGFPCQDISVAGRGKGLAGERSGLFFQIVRLAKEIKPAFIFLENVPAIRTRGLDRVIQELTQVGYDCRWTMLSAADIGANHKRQRWFLLAHAKCTQRGPVSEKRDEPNGDDSRWQEATSGIGKRCENVSDAARQLPHGSGAEGNGRPKPSDSDWWEVEPNVGRVVDGIPNRVDRLKCLGNAVVPLQAKTAFKELMGIK